SSGAVFTGPTYIDENISIISANGGSLSFGDIDSYSNSDLSLFTNGNVYLNGNVGANSALNSFNISGSGTTRISGSTINAAQVAISTHTYLENDLHVSGSNSVSFGDIDSGSSSRSLQITSNDSTFMNGHIGTDNALYSLAFDG